jgi:hypothetical protein
MGLRTLGLGVAVLALTAALVATAASASKSITPEFGVFHGQVVGTPSGGDVSVREVDVKVVKSSKRQGAELQVSPFPATCSGDLKGSPFGFSVLEKTPIPIESGKFTLDRTTHETVASGNGSAKTRTVATGTFKSATKVVVKVSVSSAINVQNPGQAAVKGTCTGRETITAKHP